MRNRRVTGRVPAAIWVAAAALGASYYALFYAASPRLWVFGILYWLVVRVFLYLYSRIQTFDILSPIIGLVVLLFLYSIASALFVEQFGVIYFGDAVSRWALAVYYVCCLVGLAGLVTGTLFASRVSETRREQQYLRVLALRTRPDASFRKKLIFWSLALGVAFGMVVLPQFNVFHVAAYSERAFALRVERSEDINSGLKLVFLSRLPVTYILCSATLLMLRTRRKFARMAGLGVFSAYVVSNTLAGWRGAVVSALLIPLLYYHYRVKPFSVRFAVIGGVSVYLFVNAIALVRVTSDPSEMVSLMRDNVGSNGLAFASLSSSGELMVGSDLMRLISGIHEGETSFTYGRSILSGMLVFVPRSFYRSRPLPLSEQFIEVFYPGMLDKGAGLGLFILQDGYWALGIPGVFFFMLAYGWLVQKIYLRFMHHLTNDLALFCYSSIYSALVMAAVRTGVFSSLKGAVINAIPFVVLSLLLKLRLPKPGPQKSTYQSDVVTSR